MDCGNVLWALDEQIGRMRRDCELLKTSFQSLRDKDKQIKELECELIALREERKCQQKMKEEALTAEQFFGQ